MNKQLLAEFEDLKNRAERLTETYLDFMAVYSTEDADRLKEIWGDRLGYVVVVNPKGLENLSPRQIDEVNQSYLRAKLGLPMALLDEN